jgi:hypothetical protein
LTDSFEFLQENSLPSADFDQSYTLHDLLDEFYALVTISHEHRSRGAEKERYNEDESEECEEEDTHTSPYGNAENS